MQGFLLLTLCAHAVGIHLGSGSSDPDFSSVKTAETARQTAVDGLKSARNTLEAAKKSAVTATSTLAATYTNLDRAEKDEKMYAQRYADNADAGWGSHVVSTRKTIETLKANRETQEEAVGTANAKVTTAESGVANAEKAMKNAKDDVALKLTTFMNAGNNLVDDFSNLQHEHHRLVAEMEAAQKASEVEASDLVRQLDNEIDPSKRAGLEADETTRAAKLTTDSTSFESEMTANQANIDAMKGEVAAFHLNANNAKKTDAKGNMPFDDVHADALKACVSAAADNHVRFVDARDKVNGAGAGCIRVHQSGTTKNDDQVYFTTTDASDNGTCNGCTSLNVVVA